MATFITGGGSQTGVALAHLLHASGRKVLFGSRSGKNIPSGFPSVRFDWADASTFANPFTHPELGEDIENVYILPTDDWDPLPAVKPFIDLAVEKGVKRFVLISAGGPETEKGPDSKASGRIHTYLDEKGLDYVAVRPTWFTENLLRIYSQGIKEQGIIETIVPTGRIPFVAVQDIAQVAFDGITNPDSLPSREPNVIGPDLISYTDVAKIFTEVLGRPITHKTISPEELIKRYTEWYSMPEEYARSLVAIEETVEHGSQERVHEDERTVVGKLGVREWVEKNKAAFA